MSIQTINSLDDIVGTIKPGELTVVAGRPCMGKSTLCWTLADKINETGRKALIVAYNAGYPPCNHNPFNVVTNSYYPTAPIQQFVDQQTVIPIKSDVFFFTAIYPFGRREATDLYSNLKRFATEANIAVVLEACVDRRAEYAEDHRPTLEHLKYFKTVGKYIDNVLLLYREGYYSCEVKDTVLEVSCAKSSSGKTGTIKLTWGVFDENGFMTVK